MLPLRVPKEGLKFSTRFAPKSLESEGFKTLDISGAGVSAKIVVNGFVSIWLTACAKTVPCIPVLTLLPITADKNPVFYDCASGAVSLLGFILCNSFSNSKVV